MTIKHIRNLSCSQYRQLYAEQYISWLIYFKIAGLKLIVKDVQKYEYARKFAACSNRVIIILLFLKYGKASALYMVATPEQRAKVGKYTAKNVTNVHFLEILIKFLARRVNVSHLFSSSCLQTCFLNNILKC